MCGITGIMSFNLVGKFNKMHTRAATEAISKRGPDFQDVYVDEWVGLGHRRLSIIDTTAIAHQPMWDESKRFAIVFNGEIFNYRELKEELLKSGVPFFSQSDTEVLLRLYIREREKCLSRLNGFFAFCIYDKQEQTLFVARDRFGIKPMLYVFDENKFIFSSEMKSIMQYGIEKDIDYNSLYSYLQLNYIPAPDSIFQKVKKLLPGHYAFVSNKEMKIGQYYEIPYNRLSLNSISYDKALTEFKTLLEDSVQRRLISDVPLGAFLSGGLDSSVITGLASRHKADLHTFSIGFRDEKFFDETPYANLVAKHFKTNHTVFSLTNDDLLNHVYDVLDYIDEPFADSSAINVFILSKETRKHATVALSGDGADELLAGYNKHAAFYRMRNPGWKENMTKDLLPLLKLLPQSRNSPLANKVRQLVRFGEGMRMKPSGRYWRWAGYARETEIDRLILPRRREGAEGAEFFSNTEYLNRKQSFVNSIPDDYMMNDILYTDTKFVLPNDMLTKVDMMSMAHSLEVRVPFLDYRVVNFLFSLPDDYKINRSIRKRILQDAFRDMLPPELYNRPKKGFEVPLLKWFRKELRSWITDDLLSKKKIEEQGIFNYVEIEKLKRQLFSSNPGDVHARIWGLIVFQTWWEKLKA